MIADFTGAFDDPEALERRLSVTVGVVEHGLFGVDLVSDIVVARGDHVQHVTVRPVQRAPQPAVIKRDR